MQMLIFVVSPALGQGSSEGHSSYASRVTKRREGRDPLRASLGEHRKKQAMEICKRAPADRERVQKSECEKKKEEKKV